MKNEMKNQLSVLFDFFKKRKLIVFSVFSIFLVNSVASISAPLYLGKVLDTFKNIQSLTFDMVLKNGKEFIAIFVLLIFIQVIAGSVLAYLKKESMIHYQKLIFDKIIMLPYLQLIKYRTAYLQSSWGRDSMNLATFYGDNLFELISNVLMIILGVSAAIIISPTFSLLVFLFILVTGSAVMMISRYLIKQLKIYLEKVASLSGKINETIAGIVELKIMGFMNFFKSAIYLDIINAANHNFGIMFKAILIFSFINILVTTGFFCTLIYFGYLIIIKQISIGSAIAYMGVVFFIMRSLTGLISGVNKINTTFASLKRTAELLSHPEMAPDIKPVTDGQQSLETINNIQLKNVWFKYDESKDYVIRNFSYTFEKGKLYALSGKSGIGKSTLIRILMGIIPAERGIVTINGKELAHDMIPLLWEKIGYMSQDPFLFKGNLIENLIPGNQNEPSIDTALIHQALVESGLDQMDLSGDINVEEGGKNFSGGEKRRISLARAFIKQSDVLILDEPTSQVDRESAEIIIDSIQKFAKLGKIAIMIAHSDMAIKKADEEISMNRLALISKENASDLEKDQKEPRFPKAKKELLAAV